jgi:hypothetical protein
MTQTSGGEGLEIGLHRRTIAQAQGIGCESVADRDLLQPGKGLAKCRQIIKVEVVPGVEA